MASSAGGAARRWRELRGTRAMAFLYLLGGLLIAYALIIGTGGRILGSVARVLAMAIVLTAALGIRRVHRDQTLAVVGVVVASILATAVGAVFASGDLLRILTACSVLLLVGVTVALIVRYLMVSAQVDGATVLGVLSIYLLIALFFSSIHEIGAVLEQGYLRGVGPSPTSSDTLYLSVITITTLGFGDITPGTNVARMVAVIEALVGQLYLVSVVAAVIAVWRPRRRATAGDPGTDQ
jgi:Ion channel